MKYYIGSLGFKTKDAARKYTRSIVNSLGPCIIKNDHEYYNFFMDLINNHSERDEKIGVGIDFFEFYIHPIYKKLSGLIGRLDGTRIDFSWVHCCEFKPRDLIANFKSALRMAIKNQTRKFKQSNSLICCICKVDDLLPDQYHVDHVKPFSLLHQEFINKTNYQIPILFDDHISFQNAIFKKEDYLLESEWVQYHHTHATLQILCKSCNLKKSNKY